MKSVTEFALHTLTKGIADRTALVAAGKTPEEIQTELGTSFKYEGDKLKHFMAAVEVAAANQEGLSRMLVVQVNEGETAPAKSVKVEEYHYVPEFKTAPRPVNLQKRDPKADGGRKGGKGDRPKTSPWGLTPEEKAAKGKAGAAKGAAKPS
jgi:hypothetical protein